MFKIFFMENFEIHITGSGPTINKALKKSYLDNKIWGILSLNKLDNFEIKGDESLLIAVLINLINNSLFFIEKCGKGQIFISSIIDQFNNLLIFKDTALGVKEEELILIKNGYYKKVNGNGFGLSFCSKVMMAMGGVLDIESEYDKHFTVILKFPKI